MRIVHISDLHLCSLNFVESWGDAVVDMLDELHADVVVVTGDLTTDGYPHEYDEAIEYLARLKCGEMLVVPGNHDARNEGFVLFEELFGTRYPRIETGEVVVQGMDSTEPDIDDGHIGRENYRLIRQLGNCDGKVKILAIHHHLIPIPGTGRERHIPVDAGDALNACVESGLHFVLSGHKHLPWVWKLQGTCFVTAGTATTRRLRGKRYPSFNILDINGRVAYLSEANVADRTIENRMTICGLDASVEALATH